MVNVDVYVVVHVDVYVVVHVDTASRLECTV